MRKYSQSLLDFINILPLKGLAITRSPISNKEAQALYDIWQGQTSKNSSVPEHVDPILVAALTTKGMIKSKFGLLMDSSPRNIEITPQGREIIRNIILHTEKSTFEKKSSVIDYEAIYHKSLHKKASEKTAEYQNPTRNSKLAQLLRTAPWKQSNG